MRENSVDERITYYTQAEQSVAPRQLLKLYLPARSALVLKRLPVRKVR